MQDRNGTATVLTIPEPCRAEVLDQLDRILRSPSFRNSVVLQSFLRFVTEKSISRHASEISEYTIATEVFGRAADFNPAVDTIVRTQAYRLRLKLDEYYRTDGLSDAILIEIPKGHYFPTFNSRHPEEAAVASTPGEMPFLADSKTKKNIYRGLGTLALCVIAFLLGGLFERVVLSRKYDALKAVERTPVDVFWQSFLRSDKQPIVAYTNALYLTTDLGDLFSFRNGAVGDRGALVDPETARHLLANRELHVRAPLQFEDDMTGVGDVLAAVAVSNALIHAGGQPSFRRGRLLTTYDLENHNVVFVGSPFVNEVLNELPNQPKFEFTRSTAPPLLWTSRIDDTSPADSRQTSYTVERAPDTGVIVGDYAVISSLTGLQPGRRVLMLGGLTTSGTAAAAQFATSLEGVAEMGRRLHRPSASKQVWPQYFEYLLRVQLSRGLDIVRSECIASHLKIMK